MRKPLVVAVAMLLIAVGLMACGQQQAAEPEERVVTEVVTQIVEGTPETIEREVVVTATPEPEEEVSFEPADPNTYVDVVFGDPETLDPATNYETAGGAVIKNVYETLITYKRENPNEFVPQLATDWEISEDGTTYTFTIREGVTFHEGGELTAEDVAYTFQRGLLSGGSSTPQWLLAEPFLGTGTHDIVELIDPEMVDDPTALQGADSEQLVQICEQVKEAIVADGNQVTMTLAQSWGPFLATIAQGWGGIVDKEWAAEQGAWDGDCATWQNHYAPTPETNPLNDIMNGTGPYILERWTPGEEVVLVRNEEYWREEPAWEGGPTGPAAIERVVIQNVEEWGTRFAMLQAGDADTVNVPPGNRPQVDPLVGEICEYQDDGSFNCQPSEENPDGPIRMYKGMPSVSRSDAFFTFEVNTEGGNNFIGSGQLDGNGIPPDFFTDIHVRRAFNYCFDWEAYSQDVYQGEAIQNVGVLIPGMLGYDQEGSKYEYDLEKCEEELNQAWDGQVAENGFRFQVAYNTGNTARQTAAQILQSNLAQIDERYLVEIIGLPWPNFLAQQRESRLPIFISGWLEDIHDPHNWAQPFTVGTYGSRQNFPEELSSQFQGLVNEGVSTTEPDARAEIYGQIQELDYENAPAIRLVTATNRHYEQRWVNGYYYNPIQTGFGAYYYTLSKE